MQIERCGNIACRRPFEVDEVGANMPGNRESEEIKCPHCYYTITRRSNGVFRTHKLSPAQEDQYNLNNPL